MLNLKKVETLLHEFIKFIGQNPSLSNLVIGGYKRDIASIELTSHLNSPLKQTSFLDTMTEFGVLATTEYFIHDINNALNTNRLPSTIKLWEPILKRLIEKVGQDNSAQLQDLEFTAAKYYKSVDPAILEKWLDYVYKIKNQFFSCCKFFNDEEKLRMTIETKNLIEQNQLFSAENEKFKNEGILAPNITRLEKPEPSDFEKIDYCYQFNPIPGYKIDKEVTKVIVNAAFKQISDQHKKQLQTRTSKESEPFFKAKCEWDQFSEDSDKKKWRKRSHDFYLQLCEHYKDTTNYPHLNSIYLWHGTDETSFKSIQKTGFAPLALTDGGFFGEGIYGTLDAKYAAIYPIKYLPNEERVLLLNEYTSYLTYPLICHEPRLSSKEKNVYDAAWILVSLIPPSSVAYFPSQLDMLHEYTELVVRCSASCIPKYKVALKAIDYAEIEPTAGQQAYEVGMRCESLQRPLLAYYYFKKAKKQGEPLAFQKIQELENTHRDFVTTLTK